MEQPRSARRCHLRPSVFESRCVNTRSWVPALRSGKSTEKDERLRAFDEGYPQGVPQSVQSHTGGVRGRVLPSSRIKTPTRHVPDRTSLVHKRQQR